MEKRIYYLSNTVIPNTKREKNIHVFNVLTQVGEKQLTDFLRTVTAASDLVDCTLVNCENRLANQSQILCGASLCRGNESLFAASWSHDQDGRHAHIW